MQNAKETPLTAAQMAMERVIRARAELRLAKAEAEGCCFAAAAVYSARELERYGVYNLRQFWRWEAHCNRLIDAKEERKAGYGH